jgi:hypothetical protein
VCENWGRETYARNHGDFERGCGRTRSVFPGVFGALRERRTHVLKKRNVGNSSATFSRGGKTAFWNGTRRSHISRLRGGTVVVRGGVARRATRVDLGGRAIRRREGCGFVMAVRKSGRSLTYLTVTRREHRVGTPRRDSSPSRSLRSVAPPASARTQTPARPRARRESETPVRSRNPLGRRVAP